MDRIKRIIADAFKIEPDIIEKSTCPDDIENWDSLGQLSLVRAIEKEYNITLEIEEIFQIMTVRDIYSILEKKGVI